MARLMGSLPGGWYNFRTQNREAYMTTRLARGRLAAALALLWTATALASAATETRTGTVQILTADDFASGTAEHVVTLVSAHGETTVLRVAPDASAGLETGARVAVQGTPDGDVFAVERVEVLAAAPAEVPSVSGDMKVIAILLKFL